MPRSPVLRDHVAAVILDKAAEILAERREAASLAEIAEAAGVARSTLYRYFPSREALLRALADSAAREIQDRIGEARPDAVPVAEAIARITRGLIATGSKYIAALAYLRPKPADAADPQVSEPLLQLFRRGVEDGTLRGDLPAETLLGSYAGPHRGVDHPVGQSPYGRGRNQRRRAQHLPERRSRQPHHAGPGMTGLQGRSSPQFTFRMNERISW
jgi:TetR/AcrR family transcriptional regulator, mexCD-oprJ operon repressor